MMFRRIFLTALLAGLIGGLGISVVQEYTTTPIILHAEKFEGGSADAEKQSFRDRRPSLIGPALAHGPVPHIEGEPGAWGPSEGLERSFFTSLANVLTGIGFALILTACFALSGRRVTGQTGIIWGLAGFGIVSLAPALGLPPEVPGAMAAELADRQMWWLLCVALTGAGLWAMIFRSGAAWMIGGIVAIALPHLIGAPQPARMGGNVPPELAAHFVSASLVTAAIFWCALGWLAGTFWQKFASPEDAEA